MCVINLFLGESEYLLYIFQVNPRRTLYKTYLDKIKASLRYTEPHKEYSSDVEIINYIKNVFPTQRDQGKAIRKALAEAVEEGRLIKKRNSYRRAAAEVRRDDAADLPPAPMLGQQTFLPE